MSVSEIVENGITYIVETFDSGTIKYPKSDPTVETEPIPSEVLQNRIAVLEQKIDTIGYLVANGGAVQ